MAGTTAVTGARYLTSGDAPAIHTATENLAKDLDRFVVGRFASGSARDTAIPAPVTDQLCMVSGQMQKWDGSAWRDYGGTVTAWTNLTAASGWTSTGARCRRNGDFIEFDGRLTKTTPPIGLTVETAATVPASPSGLRPSVDQFFDVLVRNATAGTAQGGMCVVSTAGVLQVTAGSGGLSSPNAVMLTGKRCLA